MVGWICPLGCRLETPGLYKPTFSSIEYGYTKNGMERRPLLYKPFFRPLAQLSHSSDLYQNERKAMRILGAATPFMGYTLSHNESTALMVKQSHHNLTSSDSHKPQNDISHGHHCSAMCVTNRAHKGEQK